MRVDAGMMAVEEMLLQRPAPAAADTLLLAAAGVVAAGARLHAVALDTPGAFPAEDIAALRACGLLAAPLPAALGGQDLGVGEDRVVLLADVLETIGAGSLPLGRLYEGHVNALQLVLLYGDRAQQVEAAAAVAGGALLAVWNTDDRAQPLRLQGARLQGAKILASGAGFVARPLVTATTPDGPLMLLPALAPGQGADLAGWTAQGMQASATGRVDFTGLDAPAPLGDAGDYTREPAFSGGAWRCLAVQSGGMVALLELLRQSLHEAGRDGDPHQRARFGEAAIALQTARMWVRQAARSSLSGADPAAIVATVNLARRAVEQAALQLLERVQRSIGLSAFLRPSPIERIARDLATYLRQPAPDRALDLAAAHLLSGGRAAW